MGRVPRRYKLLNIWAKGRTNNRTGSPYADAEVRVHAARRPVSFADYAGAWREGEGMSWDEVNEYVRDLRGRDEG